MFMQESSPLPQESGIEKSHTFPEPPEDGISHGGARNLFRNSAEAFGVHLSPQEDYDWLVIIGASMLVDHLVDVEKSNLEESFDAIAKGHVREDLNKDVQVRTINYLVRQSEEKKSKIARQLSKVSLLTEEQRNATKARSVVAVRIAESGIFSSLLHLEHNNTDDSEAREKFNRWVDTWSRFGYLLDSFVDIREDFDQASSQVAPTILNRLVYAKAALKEGAELFTRTPKKIVGKIALVGLRYIFLRRKVQVETN